MAEKKERQLGFSVEENKFFVPLRVHDQQNGEDLVGLIDQRKLWRERPKGEALFVSLKNENEAFVFNPINWQLIEPHNQTKKKYSALLMTTLALSETDTAGLTSLLEKLSRSLKKSAALYILEEKGEDKEKDWRSDILAEAGLMEKKILTGLSKNYLLWSGRKEKKKKSKTPIDLTAKEPRWRHGWIQGLWKKMVREHENRGFRLIDSENSEILARLKESRNPPEDIAKLKDGFGVEVVAPCDCTWKVSLNGSWIRTNTCGDPDCDGKPNIKN